MKTIDISSTEENINDIFTSTSELKAYYGIGITCSGVGSASCSESCKAGNKDGVGCSDSCLQGCKDGCKEACKTGRKNG